MLRSLSPLVLVLGFVACHPASGQECKNPRVRKSWHSLSFVERHDYLLAVKCLYEAPSKAGGAAILRYDDFASLHINQTTSPDPTGNPANVGVVGPGMHFNGVFLPWHRYFIWTYETALIEECGYRGANPYWDWTLDHPEYGSSFEKSPVFDSQGFGGSRVNGTVPAPPLGGPINATAAVLGSCVTDGLLANVKPSLGPGWSLNISNPHCIKRNINPQLARSSLGWTANVVPLLKETSYANFTKHLDVPEDAKATGIHKGGHFSIGGEMRNVWSSINDPLFLLHHTQLDRIWYMWQSMREPNFMAMGGRIWPNGTGITTLDYPIYMSAATAPDLPIRSVMDTRNRDRQGILCYVYEHDSRVDDIKKGCNGIR